jgi:methylmalonyl-CoA mutase N-terminal domain/subunit
VQELAFTLADGIHYVEECLKRGLDVNEVGRRLSFFFNAHNDVFEEIAKYRAARSLWADVMRNRFKASEESAWKLRFHAQTAGCSLQDRQPEVNLIRVAYQALAAVLGGCQSLHSNSMDETLALPSEHAVTLALRTQQVLAYETGVPNTADPVGGSYFVETLTEQMRQQAEDYFERIDQQGGMLAAIDSGFFRREIAEAAFVYQKSVDKREKIIVGVNAFEEDEQKPLDILQIDDGPEEEQLRNLQRLKKTRDNRVVEQALDNVKRAAQRKENVFPALMEAASARATVFETMSALADVLGRHETGGLS